MSIYEPSNIIEASLGGAWLRYMDHIISNGCFIVDDREDILETGPITVYIESANSDDEIISRHGDRHVIDIYIRKMFSMTIIQELNSTYGDRLFDNSGINQFEWIVDRLGRKDWTKAACVSLLKPNDPGPRIPCLTQIQMIIRNGKLILNASFRSQNVFRSYGNFLGLREIQKMAAERLEIEMGAIVSHCTCPHIYKSDIEKSISILSYERGKI